MRSGLAIAPSLTIDVARSPAIPFNYFDASRTALSARHVSCSAQALMGSRVCRLLASLAILASIGACALRQLRTLTPPGGVGSLDRRSPYLKAHMHDGRVCILSTWDVDEAAGRVTGTGVLLGPDRKVIEEGPQTVPLASVALFETNVVQKSPGVAGLAVITGISALVTGYCITNPKACFGSCPTFYVSDGERPVLQAEGFSDSVAPSLEARDIDALYRVRPAGRDLEVRMANEALETHVVRYVRILAAPRPEGGRVLATQSGELREATDLVPPAACAAAEGDCGPAVRRFDGRERFSGADPEDLATRELVDLDFGLVDGDERGLVVGARQTFLSTFLLYQSLAYMGSAASDWLARLERGDRAVVSRAHGLRRALGGIEVLVQDAHRRWVPAGEVHETGPLASDVKVVPLPRLGRGPLKVRLRLTRGHWRLDYLALARLGARVEPISLDPVEVRKEGLVVSAPTSGFTTLPGDEYDFAYRLPVDPDRYELFLDTRGYYLEWMRDEWVAEEDQARAVMLFRRPRRALRLLAPEFKKQEAGMEDLFWKSRYVRP